MEIENVRKNDLQVLVKQALASPDIKSIDVDVYSNSKNSDGYLGDIFFADAVAESENGDKKNYNLVLKTGKQNDHLRSLAPVTQIYNHEIYMYDTVFPFFDEFQRGKNLDGLDFIAKCYKTQNKIGKEAIVLENLKSSGFELHYQRKPMNLQHVCAVLRTYGKWHALSFAIRDQKRADFERLMANVRNMAMEFIKNEQATISYLDVINAFKDWLSEQGKFELLDAFNEAEGNNLIETYKELITAEKIQTVLTHGDCWNNNFMFRYDDPEKLSPSKVTLVDWQMSSIQSPVLDLCNFIYSVSSKDQLDHFDEMMDSYYSSFSRHLRNLGSNPDELFSFDDLMKHWRKYSKFGVLSVPFVLRFALCEAEDAPDFGELTEDQDFSFLTSMDVRDKDQYYKRLTDVLQHYVEFQK